MSINPLFSNNDWLANAFNDRIKKIPHLPPGAKNHIAFDAMVLGQIAITPNVLTIPEHNWKTDPQYLPFKQAISQRQFYFNNDFPSTDSTGLLVPAIIDKPNGSQNWPDLVVVFQKRALPIECKSSKNGQVTWNSGLPQADGIYVFNSDPKRGTNGSPPINRHTTFFMGQDSIKISELEKLVKGRNLNHSLAEQVNDYLKATGSKWTLYARPMFNDSSYYLADHSSVQTRESNVISHITNFKWS